MKIPSFLFAALLLLSSAAAAQPSLFEDDKIIENKVEQLLLKRDVGELANELARQKSAATDDLLIKLSVFARAGHRARVHQALREIARIYPQAENQTQIFRVAQRALSPDDLAAMRIFYDQIAVNGDARTDEFIALWSKQGAADELERWLETRAAASDEWWNRWVNFKRERGAIKEIALEIERKIRENPADFELVRRYLRVVKPVASGAVVEISPLESNIYRYEKDVSWLADAVRTDSAYEAFELALLLREVYPETAAGLLKKSLALEFTDRDRQLFGERALRTASSDRQAINPERQLRARTKAALVEIYRKTNQPLLAQPLVEELTALDTGEIGGDNYFALAGAVQQSTGVRVVESKILQAEAANENLPAYWRNRAAYYEGRNENALVWETYRKALEKFAYYPNDYKASAARLDILDALKWYGADKNEAATREILRGEFLAASAKNDYPYLFRLLHSLGDDFAGLYREFFVNTDLLAKIMETREQWNYYEVFAIRHVMSQDEWDARKAAEVWDRLAALARQSLAQRAFPLAEAMINENEELKAIPLLEECLKVAPAEYDARYAFDRDDIQALLADAYRYLGDWQKAEKLWLDGFRQKEGELGRIAVAAARRGKITEAVRLWKTHANLDRRNLESLGDLAKTEARASLRDFYRQMKAKDALTDAPDKALAILR